MKIYDPHRSGFGFVAANLVAMAAVLVGPFFGLVGLVAAGLVLLLDKKSGLVKYYATLGMMLWVVRTVLNAATSVVQGIFSVGGNVFESVFGLDIFNWGGNVAFSLLRAAIVVAVLGCSAYSAYNACKWMVWKPPFLGNLAERILKNIDPPLYSGEGPVPPECMLHTQNQQGAEPPQALPPGTEDPGEQEGPKT